MTADQAEFQSSLGSLAERHIFVSCTHEEYQEFQSSLGSLAERHVLRRLWQRRFAGFNPRPAPWPSAMIIVLSLTVFD